MSSPSARPILRSQTAADKGVLGRFKMSRGPRRYDRSPCSAMSPKETVGGPCREASDGRGTRSAAAANGARPVLGACEAATREDRREPGALVGEVVGGTAAGVLLHLAVLLVLLVNDTRRYRGVGRAMGRGLSPARRAGAPGRAKAGGGQLALPGDGLAGTPSDGTRAVKGPGGGQHATRAWPGAPTPGIMEP